MFYFFHPVSLYTQTTCILCFIIKLIDCASMSVITIWPECGPVSVYSQWLSWLFCLGTGEKCNNSKKVERLFLCKMSKISSAWPVLRKWKAEKTMKYFLLSWVHYVMRMKNCASITVSKITPYTYVHIFSGDAEIKKEITFLHRGSQD